MSDKGSPMPNMSTEVTDKRRHQ